MKTCSKCMIEKPESLFYKKSEKRGGKLRSDCKDCTNATVAKWQKANRDKVRGYVRKSCKKAYDADPEKGREKARAGREKNPENKREIVRKSYRKIYSDRHPAERARINANASARRRASPDWLDAIQRAQIMEFYDVARAVSTQTGIKHHVDHIIPIKGECVSGLNVPWNLQVIPASMNCAKKNKVAA